MYELIGRILDHPQNDPAALRKLLTEYLDNLDTKAVEAKVCECLALIACGMNRVKCLREFCQATGIDKDQAVSMFRKVATRMKIDW